MADPFTYQQAGVDIEKAERALKRLKDRIRSTHNDRVLSDIGLFGGFYQLPEEGYRQPVLVASTDGVGTKLKVALLAGVHHTIGKDLVHHCINDIATSGADPLFFLDYYACGQLDEQVYSQVITGLVEACRENALPLLGGETAEMPDVYSDGDYDLCGTIVGLVDRQAILDGSRIQAGDVLVGVASNGLHTNGYSLARKVLLNRFRLEDEIPELGTTLGEELLKVHRNYLPLIRQLRPRKELKGIAHITGGGIEKNTRRLLPEGLSLAIRWHSWPVLPVFQLIQNLGRVPEEDMRRTFNLGVGLVLIVDPTFASQAREHCQQLGFPAYIIGEVVSAG